MSRPNIATPAQINERLAQCPRPDGGTGWDAKWDAEGMCMIVRPLGTTDLRRPITDDEIAAIVMDSRSSHNRPLPTWSRSNQSWAAWRARNSTLQFREWLESLDVAEPIHPAKIFEWVWGPKFDSDYARLVEKFAVAWYVGTVARQYCGPEGFDLPCMLVLSGPQGCGKGSLVQHAVPPQFVAEVSMRKLHSDNPERAMSDHARGKALLECAELDGLRRQTTAAVKALVTRRVDRYDPKFKESRDVVRRWCMVGTSNERECLPFDPSGNRRFAVASLSGRAVHDPTVWMQTHRAALWAWARDYVAAAKADGRSDHDIAMSISPLLDDDCVEMQERQAEVYMWQPPDKPADKYEGRF